MNKKGFTLIELLAVIVVLAVVLTIAVPRILNVIGEAKKAAEASAYNIAEAVKNKYATSQLTIKETLPFKVNFPTEDVKISGTKPTGGSVTLNADGKYIVSNLIVGEYICNNSGINIECVKDTSVPEIDEVEYIYDVANIGENATPCSREGSDFTHILDKRDNKTYKVTQIGDQCWMADNLAYTTPCLAEEWTDDFHIACRISGGADWNQNEVLYQWSAAMNWDGEIDLNELESTRGLCPNGWIVASDVEWQTLELTIGVPQQEVDKLDDYFRASYHGEKLKAVSTSWNGTNTVGFNALPSGWLRDYPEELQGVGNRANFLTSTSNGDASWDRLLRTDYPDGIDRYPYQWKSNGLSVRCILGS